MSEIIHISWSGDFHRIIDWNGKEWYFEMHYYCGPIALRKDGETRVHQPNEKSPFWYVVTDWAQQGQKLTEDNYCLYRDSGRRFGDEEIM